MSHQGIFWNEEVETMPPHRIRDLQWERVKERLDSLGRKAAFYRDLFVEAGIRGHKVRDWADFRARVPFTTKERLKAWRERTRDPFCGLLCVDSRRLLHLVRTAGTTGVPTLYGYTAQDLEAVGEWGARMWVQIGARPEHTVLAGTFGSWNAFAVALLEGLRTAGVARYHFSMPAPGEEVFPLEVLSQWMEIQGAYLSARPLWHVTEKYGPRLRELLPGFQYLLMAGQHVTASFRKGIESYWGGRLCEAYAMTDAGMPCTHCTEQTETFHFPQDAFLVEILDPETGEDLSGTGRVGEIVVSSLQLEGTPLFRFRSGDMGFTTAEPCPCGRTGLRLGVVEREAHGIQVGEKLIYASDVEEVLYDVPDLFLRQYHLLRQQRQPQNKLRVRVALPPGSPEGPLKAKVLEHLEDRLGVPAEVEFLPEGAERFVAAYKFLRVVSE
ncbi:MAG: hypothetical protein DRH20_06780 [Deltaproteobacteria bacterium]|nr:MAG: hypothetical protein DRH20_06780 [Deltaproteobacteria bacterium]